MDRLRQCAGESLIETLFGLLIGSVALLMLASIMATSVKLVEQGETLLSKYMKGEQTVILQESLMGRDGIAVFSDGSPFQISLPSDGGAYRSADQGYEIKWYENSSGDESVISYRLKK